MPTVIDVIYIIEFKKPSARIWNRWYKREQLRFNQSEAILAATQCRRLSSAYPQFNWRLIRQTQEVLVA